MISGDRIKVSGGDLVVRRVGIQDSGTYICNVDNGRTTDTAYTSVRITTPGKYSFVVIT